MTFTRREFAKMSALGLAARFAPPLIAETPEKKTGYAVIGLGRIADHFMPGVLSTTNSQITGLVSGHPDKASRIAAQYGVPASSIYNYENFDEIAHNPAIDAVYVALPNSMHARVHHPRRQGRQACALREAHVHQRRRCRANDRRLQGRQRQADDRLPLPLRAHQPPRHQAHPRRRAGPGQAIESAFGFNSSPGEWRTQQETRRRRPALRRRHLLPQRLPLSHRRRPAAHRRLCLRHRPRRPLQRCRGERLLDHELPFRHRGQLHHHHTAPTCRMAIFASMDRRDGFKSIRPLSTRACASAPIFPALSSTNPTRPATPPNSRPKPNTSPIASRMV